MSSTRDREQKLENLFDIMLDALNAKIASGEATAAELNVARQLLASHNIGANPKAHDGMQELIKSLPFDAPEDDSVAIPFPLSR